MSGLSDLNFGDFSEQKTDTEVVPEQKYTRTEEVAAFFKGEEAKRDAWDDSRTRL